MKSATDSDHSIREFGEPEPSAATAALQEVLNMSTEGDLLEDISEDSYLPFIQVELKTGRKSSPKREFSFNIFEAKRRKSSKALFSLRYAIYIFASLQFLPMRA